MLNTRLIFYGTETTESDQHELSLWVNQYNEIYIQIEGDGIQYICLDKATAIKLVKVLKHNIGILTNNERRGDENAR
jgi:hypothetical protein